VLVILNLPLIPLWVQVVRIPGRILYPLVLLFCLVGAFSIQNSIFDVVVMIIFGMVGYLCRENGYEGAPLILSFVLGPMFEVNFRRSLIMSEGSFSIFLTRPIALGAIIFSLGLLLFPIYRLLRKGFQGR
jgi:putative tricarboxylic transport membrane protein